MQRAHDASGSPSLKTLTIALQSAGDAPGSMNQMARPNYAGDLTRGFAGPDGASLLFWIILEVGWLLNYDPYSSCCILTSTTACHSYGVCARTRCRAGWIRRSRRNRRILRAAAIATAPADASKEYSRKQQAYHCVPLTTRHRNTKERQSSYYTST
jgi:hypothetical protein